MPAQRPSLRGRPLDPGQIDAIEHRRSGGFALNLALEILATNLDGTASEVGSGTSSPNYSGDCQLAIGQLDDVGSAQQPVTIEYVRGALTGSVL